MNNIEGAVKIHDVVASLLWMFEGDFCVFNMDGIHEDNERVASDNRGRSCSRDTSAL